MNITIDNIAEPLTINNLTTFFIHGPTCAPNDAYTVLEPAMEGGAVVVHETSRVSQLKVENLGTRDLFIQAGDILEGGRQDRVIGVDLIVPAKSGRVPVPTFCVEQSRWSRRGGEDVKTFSSSPTMLSSLKTKLSALSGKSQGAVWASVAKEQEKLSKIMGLNVQSSESPSSYHLTLKIRRSPRGSKTP